MVVTYPPVRTNPVAKFFYKGSHSKPIRRTIIIVEINNDLIKGYELREGNTVRLLGKAPIKSYKRSNIAKHGEVSKKTKLDPKASTFQRMSLLELLEVGI